MSRTATRSVLFYAAVAGALIVIVAKKLSLIMPTGLATQIGHNSESLAFALLICAEIQLLRPRIMRSTHPWAIALPGGVFFLVAGYLLEHSDLLPSIVTLNEPVVAAGLMLLYITLPRPLPAAPIIGAVILVLIVAFFNTALVLDQAESLVPFLIAPFALDVFDRTILEPHRTDRPVLRLCWCCALVAVGVALMILARWARRDLQGPLRLGIDYGERASESYWGWLLVHFYFSYWLGRRWRGRSSVEGLRLAVEDRA